MKSLGEWTQGTLILLFGGILSIYEDLEKTVIQTSCDLCKLTALMWTNIKENYKGQEEPEWDLGGKKTWFSISYKG